MTTPRFLQIHTLHSYPAALLNRDDSGLAKRMPFGGAIRTRISSQCLKRHWRDPKDEKKHEFALHRIPDAVTATRSRNVVERMVMMPLRENDGATEDVLIAVAEAFNVGVYGGSGTSESGRQPLLLGLPEVEYLQEKAQAICGEHPDDASAAKKAAEDLFNVRRGEGANFRAFRETARLPGGLEGALFGRMVTSDPGANIDAAVHVAHAFTVHAEESESDYFSVVDDLQSDDEDPGAAHIGDMELTAGLFYGYVVVDVPGLVSNLEGCEAGQWQDADRSLSAKVVEHLIHLIATVSPAPSSVPPPPTVVPGSCWSKPAPTSRTASPTPSAPPSILGCGMLSRLWNPKSNARTRPTACRERGGLCQWTTAKFHRPSV